MPHRIAARRAALVPLLGFALAVLVLEFFLRDLGVREVRSWIAAALIASGVGAALVTLPRESLGRALIWVAVLPAFAFLIFYAILDTFLDPVLAADWPIAALAVLFALLLQALFLLTPDEDD